MGMIRRDPRSTETRDENGTAGSSSKFIHPTSFGEKWYFHENGGLGAKILEMAHHVAMFGREIFERWKR
jgi:hypothetical protein